MQYFPGRTVVMNMLRSLHSWLQKQTEEQISYEAFKEILDNTAQVSKVSAIQMSIKYSIVNVYFCYAASGISTSLSCSISKLRMKDNKVAGNHNLHPK